MKSYKSTCVCDMYLGTYLCICVYIYIYVHVLYIIHMFDWYRLDLRKSGIFDRSQQPIPIPGMNSKQK